jgi:ABC-type antimicrobial peptide transport system permease subunit
LVVPATENRVYALGANLLTGASVVVRTETAGDETTSQLRAAIASVLPDFVSSDWRTLRSFAYQGIDSLLAVMASLAGALSVLICGIAAVGVAAVFVADVRRRYPEFGIRLAVGASRRDVTRLVVVDVAKVLAVGFSLGTVILASAYRILSLFLLNFGLSDVLMISGATLLGFVTLSGIAIVIPLHRAGAADPLDALRSLSQ